MDTINKGSIEILSAFLTDRFNNADVIASADFKIMTENEDEVTAIQDWTPVENIVGLRVDCLINTTNWAEGLYKLWIRVSIPPELPIVGPFPFGVS